ncbi:MAG: M50 family metallopeptidase [Elusimicrobiota bacterium]|jgi:regulator of sigma E protease|nr:M50 family metallopeptidase [Elusimicrobiota bacterium]
MVHTISAFILAKLAWLLSWGTIKSAIGIAFALGLVIFVHELGHYLACVLLKIKVEEFAMGWGKVLKQWKRGDTIYSLRAIPVGGFLKPAGEFYAQEADIKDPREFAAQPWWKRVIMTAAGAGMNYVLAFILFFLIVFTVGLPVSDPKAIPPVVGEIVEGYPAHNSGLRKGDLITAVNAVPVHNWEEMVNNIAASAGDVNLQYKRGGQIMTASMPLAGDKKIGVALEPVYKKAGLFVSLGVAGHQCYYWTALSIKTIAKKLWQRQAPEMAGPIGIFEIVGKGVHSGAEDYFFLIGLISVAIGMFNLFPIPVLDGGHILFFVIEAIRGKKIKEKTLGNASMAGACFLLLLVAYATYGDISRLAGKGKNKQAQTASEQTAAPAATETAND